MLYGMFLLYIKVEVYQNTLKLKCWSLAFTSYKTFLKIKKGSRSSLPASFSIILRENIFDYKFYQLTKFQWLITWYSLFYNTSARHERHECDTTDTSAARVRREQHVYNTSATRTTRVRHEWDILILITTRVKTYFLIPRLAIWQVKAYKERNNFYSKNYLLEMPLSHDKIPVKSAPQKLNFVMAKAI